MPYCPWRFMLSLISLLTIMGVEGCEWMHNCTVTAKLRPAVQDWDRGFHRRLVVDVSIARMRRFIDCVVALEFRIPAGMYLDLNSLIDSPVEYDLHSPRPFDVEKRADESRAQTVFLCSRKPFVNSFVFSETMTLPVHLRYHRAHNSTRQNTATKTAGVSERRRRQVSVMSPAVLLRCDHEPTPLKSCQSRLQPAPCDCVHDPGHPHVTRLCDYIRLASIGESGAHRLSAPIGDADFVFVVVGCTSGIVLLSVATIIVALFRRQPSAKMKSN